MGGSWAILDPKSLPKGVQNGLQIVKISLAERVCFRHYFFNDFYTFFVLFFDRILIEKTVRICIEACTTHVHRISENHQKTMRFRIVFASFDNCSLIRK